MSRTEKLRPFPLGVSIGHYKVTAGTAGCVVKDQQGQEYILSNNHVLANSNNAEIGDPVIQPGSYDGGTLDEKVAILSKYVPIEFPDASECGLSKIVVSFLNAVAKLFMRKTRFYTKVAGMPVNEVDCAIAEPTSQNIYEKEILEVGCPKGSAKVHEGETVKKSGRTTGVTTGEVIDDDATIDISYGYAKARFTHQILIQGKRFIQGGDSGSALLNEDGYIVGLCFAGSNDGSLGIANHIYKVEELLEVRCC
jgi:hypothetical protein